MRGNIMKRNTVCALCALMLMMIPGAPRARAEDMAWEAGCTDAPYTAFFEDDARRIAVASAEMDGAAYLIADVQLRSADGFCVAGIEEQEGEPETPADGGAVLAFGGDGFAQRSGGVILRNGRLLRAASTSHHMLVVDGAGNLSVRTDRKNERPRDMGELLVSLGVLHTFEAGPELIRYGGRVPLGNLHDRPSRLQTERAPRTAIAQIGPLHYAVLVTRDGAGMTLPQVQDALLACGAQTAFQLCSGRAQLWFRGDLLTGEEAAENGADWICF